MVLPFVVVMLAGTNTQRLAAGEPQELRTWLQTDWSGGPGYPTWSDVESTGYEAGDAIDAGAAGQLGLGHTLPHTADGDLNQDGYPDIVFANWLDQYPPQRHDVDSYVYWGSADGFRNERRMGLPTRGAVGVSIADLDNDGFLDLVFSNQRGGRYENPVYGVDSYIYWGGPGGYSVSHRTGLPTLGCMSSAIADLDGDGYLDVVFANSTDGVTVQVDSHIYWGGSEGFSADNRTGLPVQRAVAVSAADLNQDGYLDLIFSNTTDGRSSETDSYIYWGGSDGYTPLHRTGLPTNGAYDNTVADLNGDGHLDLVFSNRYHSVGGLPLFGTDSYIYWGSSTGYSPENRSELPTVGAVGVSAADLDEDGYQDLVFSNGSDDDSYIYWGNADAAYGEGERSSVRAYRSLGNSIADLNGDNHLDLIFSSDWNGLIYWGDGSRHLSSRRLTLVQTVSSLSNAVAGARLGTAGASLGTVYTRPFADGGSIEQSLVVPRIYASEGHLDSSAFDAWAAARWLSVEWRAEVTPETAITLALATSDDGLAWSAWTPALEVTPPGDGAADLADVVAPSRFVRYRVGLSASSDHRRTPRLLEFALHYELLGPTVTPTSTATPTPTPTASYTPSPSPTSSPTPAPSPSATLTPTATDVTLRVRYLPFIHRMD